MTAQIPMLDYATASDEVRAAWDGEVAKRGRMTAMKRTLLHSVPAYHAFMEFYTIYDRLVPVLGKRTLWLFCHTISNGNDCLVCTTYFRRALIEAGIPPETYEPSADETLIMDFGHHFSHAGAGTKPSAELWAALHARLDDAQLVDLATLGGLMVANNLFNDVVGVELDESFHEFRAPAVPA